MSAGPLSKRVRTTCADCGIEIYVKRGGLREFNYCATHRRERALQLSRDSYHRRKNDPKVKRRRRERQRKAYWSAQGLDRPPWEIETVAQCGERPSATGWTRCERPLGHDGPHVGRTRTGRWRAWAGSGGR